MATVPRKARTKIKPPRKHGPDVSIEDTWSRLSENIRQIFKHNAANLSFEENHRMAYNMVLHRSGEMLYKGVCQLVVENLGHLARDEVIPAFPTTGHGASGGDRMQQTQEGESLLKALRRIWDDHVGSMSKLKDILKYMDRVYTKTADVPEIWDAGYNLFVKHILKAPISQHIFSAVLTQIQIERDGYPINRSAVKECVDVLLLLRVEDGAGTSVYKRDLEPAILKESEAFYKGEGERLLESCDAPEYLQRVESRFESEESRTHHYLSSQTSPPLRKILERDLLTPNLSTIIHMPNSGLDIMIDTDKMGHLARLYRLFGMVPAGLPCLRKALKASISRRGQDINRSSSGADGAEDVVVDVVGNGNDESKGKGKARVGGGAQNLALALKWVQEVLDLKDKFDHVWREAFRSDRDLESALNEAFESFINVNERAPEFISLFIDENLKKGLKGKTETEVDAVLDKTITVFRFITEKDVFERHYKNHLAKRLLLGRSVSDDAERGMLAKLKVECGYQFTQKLEGMFHDMKLSSDTMEVYQEHLAKTDRPPIDISVIVMTSTFWPMSQAGPTCNLPDALMQSCEHFKGFYLSRHTGRRLTWQPSLGNADVRVSFDKKKHDLNVSTFALVILLLFEDLPDDDILTYEEIKSATQIPENELQRQLQSLACAKFKILKKHPPSRDVHPSDSFSFNHQFTSSMQKIKISTIVAKVETGDERKETRDRIDEERKHQTEACIVRIMKDRKHLAHNTLVNEVTRQLASRFSPNPLDIKKRIEGLIERDYLERCEDRKSYNYLA